MQLKLTSLSSVAQSFIVIAACVAAPSVALGDGVFAWGYEGANTDFAFLGDGRCTIPTAAQSGVSAIAGGGQHTIALKGGEVLAWGSNQYGQCTIPDAANSGVSAIACGGYFTIALKNGEVLAWGTNYFGEGTVPNSAKSGVTAIAAAGDHVLALKNGGVLAWGRTIGVGTADQPQVPEPSFIGTGISAIACGDRHNIIIAADCDGDGVADNSEIAGGAADINTNGVPDSCETDCNGNGQPDGYELAQGTAHDYNNNGVLDSCDIAGNSALDRNLNGIPDSYEIAQNAALDRNLNGVLDSYEIAQTPALDANGNGIPDSVDLAAANAQVAALTAQLNCGDLNGDNEVNGEDFGLQLLNYGPCPQ